MINCIEQKYVDKSPIENTTAHIIFKKKKMFNYYTLLGELMYVYITCCPSIGYAVTTLLEFSSALTDYHYNLLKGVAKYLHNTIEWCI